MRSVLSLLAALTLGAPVVAQPKLPNLPPHLLAPTDPLSPEDERKQFVVPPGFAVQLVASEPDIQKPMQMAFDAKGRLWVTTSYHYPFASAGQPTDKLFVLSDIDPKTGKAGKVTTFASDLNIPIGILPLPDCKSCIVSSVGEIRKYTDTNDDGKADKMEVLYRGFGARDTHGMYNSFTLMPDGWVYACHGFNNDSTVRGKDGHEIKLNSGSTFRFRPDGSRIEVWTRGQVNPFGMAVDPWFNLYTADCHSKPITQLLPGAYYESFGKPHDGLGFTPHVTAHPHKSTGLCGLVWYDADHFPKEWAGTMLLGDVVSNCISADRIEWRGSTPVAKELPDFLTSKDRWFRPVDIKLGPDGTLYVADFYNKIIGHYEVDLKDPRRDKDRGRLWRIVWTGTDGKVPPPFAYTDLTKQDVRRVYQLLDSPNLAVRLQATNQLIHRSEDMARALKTGIAVDAPFSERGMAHTFWQGNARSIDPSGTVAALTTMKQLRTPFVLAHELRMAGAEPKWDADLRAAVAGCLKDGPMVQRAAVEAIIRHPHAEFVQPLLDVVKKTPGDDPMLRQGARIALRNCLRDDPKAWPAAYEPAFADVALAIPSAEAATYLQRQIEGGKLADALPRAAEHAARYGASDGEGVLFAALAAGANADAMLAAFRGVQARGSKLSAETTAALVAASQKALGDPAKAGWGLRVLNGLPAVAAPGAKLPPDAIQALKAVAANAQVPAEQRVQAADALLKFAPADALATAKTLLADATTPEPVRVGVLLAFASSNVKDAQTAARDALADQPYRVAVQLGLGLAGTRDGAQLLFDAIKQGKGPPRLLQEKAVLERLKASNVPGWEKVVGELTRNLPPADQRLAGLLKQRATGFASAKASATEGAKVFAKHCAACHKIGDAGGKIAPQLDGIGLRGAERLLEDTLDPNRNVDQAFRARSITTSDERTITALVLREEGEVLVVADLEGKEKRIPKKEIVGNRETALSAMPANFADVIPEGEFYHLLAYLLDQKAKDPPKK